MNNFAKGTLTVGYFAALIIATFLMISSSWYLYHFMTDTTSAVEKLLQGNSETTVTQYDYDGHDSVTAGLVARFAMTGFAFNSCGLCVGIAIAFLGLAMFLIGARGQMDASAEAPNVSVTISQMSPGALAIVCATAIIITCMINRPHLELENPNTGFRGDAVGSPGPGGEDVPPAFDPA